jgi:hypothetical protein
VSVQPKKNVQDTWARYKIGQILAKLSAYGNGPIESVNTVTASGSTLTLPDVTTATMHDVTLTADCAFTFPAAGAGKSFSVRLVQDGTGGRTATWDSSAKWPGGTAPTLSTAARSVDTFAFVCFDGTRFEAFFAGKGHA